MTRTAGPCNHNRCDESREGFEEVFEEIAEVAPEVVAGRIDVLDRIISDVAVAVERLRIARRRDDRIGRDEPGEYRIIISCAVVVEAELRIKNLAREPPAWIQTTISIRGSPGPLRVNSTWEAKIFRNAS
jgi:hypothetical protein